MSLDPALIIYNWPLILSSVFSSDAGKFKEAFEQYQNEPSAGDTSTDTVGSSTEGDDKTADEAITDKLDKLTVKEEEPKTSEDDDKTASNTQETVDWVLHSILYLKFVNVH